MGVRALHGRNETHNHLGRGMRGIRAKLLQDSVRQVADHLCEVSMDSHAPADSGKLPYERRSKRSALPVLNTMQDKAQRHPGIQVMPQTAQANGKTNNAVAIDAVASLEGHAALVRVHSIHPVKHDDMQISIATYNTLDICATCCCTSLLLQVLIFSCKPAWWPYQGQSSVKTNHNMR